MDKLKGTGVALVTPFNEDETIDYASLEKMLKHTADSGANYYVVLGTTGESATLSWVEQRKVLEFVKSKNLLKLPIIYGLGSNSTSEVLKEIGQTDFSEVSAILSVCPYYNKPSQTGIVAHYTAIANKSPVPVIMYNVPGRTGVNMKVDTILKLAKHPNIVAVKEASGNLNQAMGIMKGKPDNFMLISGDDGLIVPLMSIGAVGIISVLGNAYSNIFKTMIDECNKSNYQVATQASLKLLPINSLIYEEGNPVGVKQVLAEMGVCNPYVRLPLCAASEDLKKRIKKEMGLIK